MGVDSLKDKTYKESAPQEGGTPPRKGAQLQKVVDFLKDKTYKESAPQEGGTPPAWVHELAGRVLAAMAS